jgi:hypothetical protein
MYPRLYERIQELLGEGNPVISVRDMIGWVDFREHMIATYGELAEALRLLHQAGRVARVLEGYADPETQDVTEPLRVPTLEEYEEAVAEYLGKDRGDRE